MSGSLLRLSHAEMSPQRNQCRQFRLSAESSHINDRRRCSRATTQPAFRSQISPNTARCHQNPACGCHSHTRKWLTTLRCLGSGSRVWACPRPQQRRQAQIPTTASCRTQRDKSQITALCHTVARGISQVECRTRKRLLSSVLSVPETTESSNRFWNPELRPMASLSITCST